jgi:hypothetical protein
MSAVNTTPYLDHEDQTAGGLLGLDGPSPGDAFGERFPATVTRVSATGKRGGGRTLP